MTERKKKYSRPFLEAAAGYVANTYIFETIDKIKAAPLYRQRVKQLANRLAAWVKQEDAIVQHSMCAIFNPDYISGVFLLIDDAMEERRNKIEEEARKQLGDILYRDIYAHAIMAMICAEIASVETFTMASRQRRDTVRMLLSSLMEAIGMTDNLARDLCIKDKAMRLYKMWQDGKVFVNALDAQREAMHKATEP